MINIGISPVAFSIGSLEVRWYGIIVTLSIVALVLWTIRAIRKDGTISYDTILTAALVGIPSGVIVSRLLHVIDRWDYFGQNLGQLVGFAGLTFYGAVLGGTLAIWIYSRVSKFRFGYLADLVAPGVVLAQAIGRVGCLVNGCCYGVESTLPWAICYTDTDSFGPIGIAVHPTQIYEIIYNLILFGVLLKLRGRFTPDGSLFLIYLGLYALWRLVTGFLRDGTPFILGLQQAQVIGIIVLAIVVPLLAYRTHRVRAEDSAGNVPK